MGTHRGTQQLRHLTSLSDYASSVQVKENKFTQDILLKSILKNPRITFTALETYNTNLSEMRNVKKVESIFELFNKR